MTLRHFPAARYRAWLRREFRPGDGLRDLYVLGTTLADWQAVLDSRIEYVPPQPA